MGNEILRRRRRAIYATVSYIGGMVGGIWMLILKEQCQWFENYPYPQWYEVKRSWGFFKQHNLSRGAGSYWNSPDIYLAMVILAGAFLLGWVLFGSRVTAGYRTLILPFIVGFGMIWIPFEANWGANHYVEGLYHLGIGIVVSISLGLTSRWWAQRGTIPPL